MIVITGAAGFIGSCMVSKLNRKGIENILIVDDFSIKAKEDNYNRLRFSQKIERDDFLEWFANNPDKISYMIHLGARTDTAEFDWQVLLRLNLDYTKEIWKICSSNNIPLIYASSAATYGDGEMG